MANELHKIHRRLYWIGAGIGAILLIAAAWSISRVVSQHSSVKRWVNHTREVIVQLDEILQLVQAAETGQRGYLLTGRETYLRPYETSVGQIGPSLDRLTELIRDNPPQQQRVEELRAAWSGKLSELQETLRVRRDRGFTAANDIVLGGRGQEAMSHITSVLAQMRNEEEALLKLRTEHSSVVTRLLYQITLILFVVTVGLSFALFRLIGRVKRLQAGLVSVCAWTKHVRLNGEWVPVDVYLADRFGLSITHGISEKAAKELLPDSGPERDPP